MSGVLKAVDFDPGWRYARVWRDTQDQAFCEPQGFCRLISEWVAQEPQLVAHVRTWPKGTQVWFVNHFHVDAHATAREAVECHDAYLFATHFVQTSVDDAQLQAAGMPTCEVRPCAALPTILTSMQDHRIYTCGEHATPAAAQSVLWARRDLRLVPRRAG